MFLFWPQGGPPLAGKPSAWHGSQLPLLMGGLGTGGLYREQVGGARGPRRVDGPPLGGPPSVGWFGQSGEADEQKMVSPREARRLLRGPREAKGRGRGPLRGVVCRTVTRAPAKEHPLPQGREVAGGHRRVTFRSERLGRPADHTEGRPGRALVEG